MSFIKKITYLCFIFIFAGCSSHSIKTDKKDSKLFDMKNINNKNIKFYKDTFYHKDKIGKYRYKKIKNKEESLSYDTKKIDKLIIYFYDPKQDKLYFSHNISRGISLYGLTKRGGYIKINYSYNYLDKESVKEELKANSLTTDYKIVNPNDLGFAIKKKYLNPYLDSSRNEYGNNKYYIGVPIEIEIVDYRPIISKYKKAILAYDSKLLDENDICDLNLFIKDDITLHIQNASSFNQIDEIKKIAKYSNITIDKNILLAKTNQLNFSNKYEMLSKANYVELKEYLSDNDSFYGIDSDKIDKLKKRKDAQYIVHLRELNSFDGFVKAYEITKSQDDISQAYKLAKTDIQKSNIEDLLVQKLGFDKLFDIVVNKKFSKLKKFEDSGFGSSIVGMYKTIYYTIDVKPKNKALLDLKYNTYNAKIQFTIHMKANTEFIQKLLKNDEVKEHDFKLSFQNGYKNQFKFEKDMMVSGKRKGLFLNEFGFRRYGVKNFEISEVELKKNILFLMREEND
jgi:hypothetical protein